MKIWRRERDSNPSQAPYQINKLLIPKSILSPPIPASPHSWHQSCHRQSLSSTAILAGSVDFSIRTLTYTLLLAFSLLSSMLLPLRVEVPVRHIDCPLSSSNGPFNKEGSLQHER